MVTTDEALKAGTDDGAAIAELEEIVARQRDGAARRPEPFARGAPRAASGALAAMVLGHRVEIQDAIVADFGVHPRQAADLIEVLGPAARAGYAAEHLEEWMAPEAAPGRRGPLRLREGVRAPQPKGVVGNIVPWNFPFDLSVGPLVEMLAAGNRVVIKPSEYTPASATLLRDMVRATFDRDRVDVVVGGLELARGLRRRPLGPPAVHGQPGDRARDRHGRGRAARAGDARARAASARRS